MLKRGFRFWSETTDIYIKLIPLFLATIAWWAVIYLIEPKYVQRISQLSIPNIEVVYLCVSILMLLIFCIALVNVLDEAIRDNAQMMYWLVLSKEEYFIYIFMKKIHWYYFFVCVMNLFSGQLCGNKAIMFALLTVIYIMIASAIYWERYAAMYRGNRTKHGMAKECKQCRERSLNAFEVFLGRHANIELIWISWKYRYASMERVLCKAGVTAIGIFLLSQSLSVKQYFIAYFVLFFILMFVEDNYWKKEIMNTGMLRTMGVSFSKYFGIHGISGILFYAVVPSILCGLASKSLLCVMIFFLVTICFVGYWSSVYLYIYLLIGNQNEWLKQLILIVTLMIEFIPGIHLIAGILFYRKAGMMWRKAQC